MTLLVKFGVLYVILEVSLRVADTGLVKGGWNGQKGGARLVQGLRCIA